MTAREIDLIENSWEFILNNTTEPGMLFYDKLFQIDPQLWSLFKADLKSQSQKLITLITFAISKLHNIDEIIQDVQALGKRHVGYKVQPGHYAIVGEALIWTLEKGSGFRWNEETMKAWVKLYSTLSQIMIEAGSNIHTGNDINKSSNVLKTNMA